MGEKTANYGLALAGCEDRVERGAVNGNWEKVDTALFGKPNVVLGSYSGSNSYPRTIELGAPPKAILLYTNSGMTNGSGSIFGGLFGPGKPLGHPTNPVAQVSETGFTLLRETVNRSGDTFFYLAVL